MDTDRVIESEVVGVDGRRYVVTTRLESLMKTRVYRVGENDPVLVHEAPLATEEIAILCQPHVLHELIRMRVETGDFG